MTGLQKDFGITGVFKTVAAYGFDDMGRLKTKHLDPDYRQNPGNATEMESLTYSYNIQNQITGINKDYALKSGGYNKWGHYFGLYLGYDDNTNFAAKQLDGHVTGQLWNTQGDDDQRRYDYTYDNAGRLTGADFKQHTGSRWGRATAAGTAIDFSVNSLSYDLNGNLQRMVQMGVQAGNSTALPIDDLAYSYAQYSNRLAKVTDNGSLGTANGSMGDFKDGANGGADDYVFDANGNLVVDLNKNVQDGSGGNGITYNFLDKPEHINIAGKGVVDILYDADGGKLQRTFTPTAGTPVTTTYINGFVYQGNSLQSIGFEEGRLRPVQTVSSGVADPGNSGAFLDAVMVNGSLPMPDNTNGTFDFFIRDYQQNVRMIVTEETHVGYNTATMEDSRGAAEEPLFGQQGNNNELVKTRADAPGGWRNLGNTGKVSRLGKNTPGGMVGPNSLLKVMAGDQISATTDYYYENGTTAPNPLATDVLNALVSAIGGARNPSSFTEYGATGINGQLSGVNPFSSFVDGQADPDRPKAYLNVLFFDERFQFLSDASQRVQVGGAGTSQMSLSSIWAPKNGYAYIYVSNDDNRDVFFDNLKVADERGRLIEEDHYYAYGLKIAGISSKKLPDASEVANIKNNNFYNDKELFDDGDLDWYDYGFRNYDAQIGRFVQLDPLTWEYPELTNYQYASCEPVANVVMGQIGWFLK